MDYDSDDLVSDQEGFSEDFLNNDEYDQLYSSLPLLKTRLENYNSTIPESDLKEILYNNYFDIESSVQEIKETYRKNRTYEI